MPRPNGPPPASHIPRKPQENLTNNLLWLDFCIEISKWIGEDRVCCQTARFLSFCFRTLSGLLPFCHVGHCLHFFIYLNKTLQGAMELPQVKGFGFTILSTVMINSPCHDWCYSGGVTVAFYIIKCLLFLSLCCKTF